MKGSGIRIFSFKTNLEKTKHLGICLSVLMTIVVSATILQSCAKEDKTVQEIAPEYEGLLSGITVSNPRKSDQDIELVKEEVLITVSMNEYKFNGTYVLKNDGSDKEIELGLPLFIPSSIPRWEDSGRYLETPNLEVKVDGKEVKAEEKKLSKVEEVAYLELDRGKQVRIKPESVVTPWMIWKQSFKAKQSQTIKITYNRLFDKRVKLGRDDKYLDPIQVYYISNGGPWKGNPVRKVSFKIEGIKKDYLSQFRLQPKSVNKNLITFELKDKDQEFVGIGFRPGLKDKDVLNAIKAKMKKDKNKEKYIVRLGNEYKQRKMYKEQQKLYLDFVKQNKTKLTEKLMNLKSERVVESITENIPELKDKEIAKELAQDMVPIIKKQIELNAKETNLSYKSAKRQRDRDYNNWLEVYQKVL